ncbi:MAG: hypothetical protein DRJ10_14250, partial [Bacteroidetes bacterium]
MPKPKYDYTTFSIKKLLDDVTKKSGIQIHNIADCGMLSGILSKEGIQVSDSTLARLFKVIVSKSVPSKYTLDILSAYVGYQHWDDFYNQFRKENDENAVVNDLKSDFISNNELMLLKFCIEDNAFNPAINYLNKITPFLSNPYSADSFKVANQLGYSIRNNQNAQKTLIPYITKNEIIRDMFYTWWVDMDGLNSYYAAYIQHSYLKHIHPNDQNFNQNEIWAYCMLMYHALYADNIKEYSRNAYYLFNKYQAEDIILTDHFNAYPFSRFHSNHIIYNGLIKNANNKWFDKKVLFIKTELLNVAVQSQVIVLSQIVEALVISGKFEIVLQFIEEYYSFLRKHLKNSRFDEEEDSLIKLIYYFHFAFREL